MKKRNCMPCVFMGKTSIGECRDYIYLGSDDSVSVPLCYSHSVELFKNGQKVFVKKYGMEELEKYHNRALNETSDIPFFFNSFR